MRWDDKKCEPFYQSRAWKRARLAVLIRDGYHCQRCKRRDADTVHHIKPREQYPELALDMGNLESICRKCHNQEHPERARRPGSMKTLNLDGVRVIRIS